MADTIGGLLDEVLTKISDAMNDIVVRLDALESRVEYSGEVVEVEPLEEWTVATPPTITRTTTDVGQLANETHFIVDAGVEVDRLDLTGRQDVRVEVNGRINNIWLADAHRIEIFGTGKVGNITASEWVAGNRGFRNSDLAVRTISVDGPETAFDIQFTRNVLLQGINTTGINRYGVWLSSCQNAYIRDCLFETEGEESCVRMVDVQFAHVRDSFLRSNYKHCFRVHGESKNIALERSTLVGPRAMMIGTMSGDSVSNVTIQDNWIRDATVHLLGLPADVNQLSSFTWRRNTVQNSQDLPEARSDTWVIE